MLCHGESFAEGVALGRGILCYAFEEHDEEIGSLAILTKMCPEAWNADEQERRISRLLECYLAVWMHVIG